MTDKEVIKILEQHGWQIVRINGSHHRMSHGSLKIEKQTGVKLR